LRGKHGQNGATVLASLSASFQILGSSDELASCQSQKGFAETTSVKWHQRCRRPAVSLIIELPAGRADPLRIKGGLGGAHGAGKNLKIGLVYAGLAPAHCTYVEEKIMKQLGLMLSVVAMTYATNAVADQLKGTYSFTATGICLYALPDFLTGPVPFIAPDGAVPNSGYFTQYFDTLGTVTFNGNGTGTSELSSQGFRLSPQLNIFGPFATVSTLTGSFTYTVTDDTLNYVPGTFNGMTTVGFGAGTTFTIENIPPLTGQISKDRKTIIQAALTPGVETVTAQNGTISKRVCTNSRVLIKMDAD
jgi:hypothetical protein